MLKILFTRSKKLFSVGIVAVLFTVFVAALVLSPVLNERGHWGSLWSEGEEVRLSKLPPEARETLKLIKSGGPFRFREDGVVFRNQQKKLPLKRRGYYRVYVVPTPGVEGTGERRIVAGCGSSRQGCEYWYTSDNYEVLHRICE